MKQTQDKQDAILKHGWKQVRQAQNRNKGIPNKVVEREVHIAIDEVRQSNKPN